MAYAPTDLEEIPYEDGSEPGAFEDPNDPLGMGEGFDYSIYEGMDDGTEQGASGGARGGKPAVSLADLRQRFPALGDAAGLDLIEGEIKKRYKVEDAQGRLIAADKEAGPAHKGTKAQRGEAIRMSDADLAGGQADQRAPRRREAIRIGMEDLAALEAEDAANDRARGYQAQATGPDGEPLRPEAIALGKREAQAAAQRNAAIEQGIAKTKSIWDDMTGQEQAARQRARNLDRQADELEAAVESSRRPAPGVMMRAQQIRAAADEAAVMAEQWGRKKGSAEQNYLKLKGALEAARVDPREMEAAAAAGADAQIRRTQQNIDTDDRRADVTKPSASAEKNQMEASARKGHVLERRARSAKDEVDALQKRFIEMGGDSPKPPKNALAIKDQLDAATGRLRKLEADLERHDQQIIEQADGFQRGERPAQGKPSRTPTAPGAGGSIGEAQDEEGAFAKIKAAYPNVPDEVIRAKIKEKMGR